MKFKFKISKLANQFFFISNLSEWYFSCRKDYNQKWLKQTGPLNEKESRALEQFRNIIKKYGFFIDNKTGKTEYLGQIFFSYPEKETWNKLKTFVNKKEYLIIKNTFNALQTKFEKIWELKELSKKAKNLEKSLKSQQYRELFDKLVYLFDNKRPIQKITIIALASPLCGEGITAAGGANIDNNCITLEIPKLKFNSWEFEYSIGIIAHEVAHILFRQSNGQKIIQKIIKKIKFRMLPKNLSPHINPLEFISEFVIESLTPFGYLSQKYFIKFNPLKFTFSKSNLKILAENFINFKENKPSNTHRLRKLLIWQLYPFIINQIELKKKIDKKFIEKISKFIFQTLKIK